MDNFYLQVKKKELYLYQQNKTIMTNIKDKKKIDWFNAHSGDDFRSSDDLLNLSQYFGIDIIQNDQDCNIQDFNILEYNIGIENQIPDSIKAKFLVKLFNTITVIEQDADFTYSQVKSLNNLQSIGRYAYFENSLITSLGNLQYIGEDAYFGGS